MILENITIQTGETFFCNVNAVSVCNSLDDTASALIKVLLAYTVVMILIFSQYNNTKLDPKAKQIIFICLFGMQLFLIAWLARIILIIV